MVRRHFDLDRPKPSPHPADDEFNGAALDTAWTVVAGTPGAVNLIGTTGGIYDLTTRPGWLLMQPDTSTHITLRKAYTLADGESVVAALAITLNASGESGITDSYLDCGIELSDSDSYHSGNWATCHFDSEVEGWRIYAGSSSSGRSVPGANAPMLHLAGRFYFRILRVGLTYTSMWSVDGTTWFPFAAVTMDAPLDRLWLFTRADDNIPDPLPICGCNWVRIGGSGIDPW